jgi:hypothetical protein
VRGPYTVRSTYQSPYTSRRTYGRILLGTLLTGFQVGPADVVATLSAANSAWGWISGLQGITSILNFLKDSLDKSKNILKPRKLSPASCQMLTFHGTAEFIDEGFEKLGDSYFSKMVGLTICALAHELGLSPSINMLMRKKLSTLS